MIKNLVGEPAKMILHLKIKKSQKLMNELEILKMFDQLNLFKTVDII